MFGPYISLARLNSPRSPLRTPSPASMGQMIRTIPQLEAKDPKHVVEKSEPPIKNINLELRTMVNLFVQVAVLRVLVEGSKCPGCHFIDFWY